MNSTEKGDLFENKVHAILINCFTQDKLFISGKNSLICVKPNYYSKDREKNINFDLSIEVYRDGAESPNLIILIECKDCKRPLSVDDVEEFYSKKQQIARANSKCLLFTRSSLQEAAFNYATNVGIGVVRILDDDSMMWLIERSDKNLTTSTANTLAINVINALTNEYFVSTHNSTFAYSENQSYTVIDNLIFSIVNECP